MAWHTEVINGNLKAFIKLERERPYLTSILLHSEPLIDQASARLANYLIARKSESIRTTHVSHGPYHVVLDPSSVCNLRCPLCVHVTEPNGRTRGILDERLARTIIESASDTAIRLDLFNWGEPLLNPNFSKIAKIASDLGLYTRTSSHFSFEPAIDWNPIVASGLKYIVASIDGASQQNYQKYRVRGKLDLALSNLKALSCAKRENNSIFPLVEWQFLVFQHNFAEIEQARNIAQQAGVDIFRYGGARAEMASKTRIPTPSAVARSSKYLLTSDHPLSEYDGNGQKVRLAEEKACRWLWGKTAIHSNGHVAPCWSAWNRVHDIGSVTLDDLQSIWRGPRMAELRELATTGGNLAARDLCGTCAYQKNFVPPPDRDDEPLPDIGDLASNAHIVLAAAGRGLSLMNIKSLASKVPGISRR